MTTDLKTTKAQIQADITSNPVVLYMKGDKSQPQCGFSSQVVQILTQLEVDFVTRDILADETLRQAIKEFSDWPTIPQLYINGEFIGGCDITTELFQSGELQQILGKN